MTPVMHSSSNREKQQHTNATKRRRREKNNTSIGFPLQTFQILLRLILFSSQTIKSCRIKTKILFSAIHYRAQDLEREKNTHTHRHKSETKTFSSAFFSPGKRWAEWEVITIWNKFACVPTMPLFFHATPPSHSISMLYNLVLLLFFFSLSSHFFFFNK